MDLVPLRRRLRKAGRRVREARMLIRAFKSPYQPVAAHLIPTRRCNLSCDYCNEYDDHSTPVATETVFRRIDSLAALGTGIVTLSGGEPLLHPDLDAIIHRIRHDGMIATLITNGYLLTRDRIERLNKSRARLPSNQYRQRRAGRGVEEEPENARPETTMARSGRRVQRHCQLGRRRWDPESRRCRGDYATRTRPWFFDHHRDHS